MRMARWFLGAFLLGWMTVTLGCSGEEPQVGGEVSSPLVAPAGQQAAGVSWTKPARWALMPERPMRAATYLIPAASSDSEDAECGVFFFGPGQGGSVQDNLRRWAVQFERPRAAKQNQQVISNFIVHTLDLAGTYLSSAGSMGPATERKAHFRMLAAIVEAPDGLVFFKLTGPEKAVEAADPEFKALLASLKRR